MPELPEIEGLREQLADREVGRAPASIKVRQFALVKTFNPPLDTVIGRTSVAVGRRGKHLLMTFEGDIALAVHLGIGGRIVPIDPGGTRKGGRSTSLELEWDDGSRIDIVELGTKKRSSVHVLHGAELDAHLGHLGIDALSPDLTPELLETLLAAERAQLKHFLVDQRRIAGIGNAYSDEILWQARLSPLRLTTTVTTPEVEALHLAIREVLSAAIGRARAENYLTVARGDKRGAFQAHRREGEPCSRCGEAIASIHFADRSLQYCPACQVEGRRYADRRLSRLLR